MNLANRHYSQNLRKYYRMPSVQVSLTLVMSLFLMAVFVVFALRPTILSIVNLQKTIGESKKILQQLEAKVGHLQQVSSQIETLKPILSIINTSIPNNGATYSSLTMALESLAIQSGVILESETVGPTLLFSRIISPFTPNKNQNVVALPFSLRASGSYPGVSAFLNKLLSMERIVMVETITIARQAGSKNIESSVTLSLSGNTYYLADEPQLEKALLEKKGGR